MACEILSGGSHEASVGESANMRLVLRKQRTCTAVRREGAYLYARMIGEDTQGFSTRISTRSRDCNFNYHVHNNTPHCKKIQSCLTSRHGHSSGRNSRTPQRFHRPSIEHTVGL